MPSLWRNMPRKPQCPALHCRRVLGPLFIVIFAWITLYTAQLLVDSECTALAPRPASPLGLPVGPACFSRTSLHPPNEPICSQAAL